MDAPSSDGIEVLSYTRAAPLGSPLKASTSAAPPFRRANDDVDEYDDPRSHAFRTSPVRHRPATGQQALFNSPTPDLEETQRDSQLSDDDEDVVVVSATMAKDTVLNHSDSDDSLPDLNQLRKTHSGAVLAGTAQATATDRTRTTTSTAKDKGKGRAAPAATTSTATTKRSRDVSTEAGPSAPAAKKKASTTSEERAAKKARDEAEKVAKKALKAANTLKRDRTITVRELTTHISGTAFDVLPDDAPANPSRRGGAKQKKATVSPWIAITNTFKIRMMDVDNLGCNVQMPDMPRRDLGSEGAMRWTRVCDRKWNDELKRFVPLPHGKQLVVEEDVRVVFMTAAELSHLVADGKLVAHVKAIQAQVQPHVTLTIMLYGIRAIDRAIKNAHNAEVRDAVRQQLEEDKNKGSGTADDSSSSDDGFDFGNKAAVNKSKKGKGGGGTKKQKQVGIGERQPSKDELELALMRAQMATKCMIVRVERVDEAVDWLEQITKDVSFKPYQRQKQSHAVLLGTSEGISSGQDQADTYRKMLASIKGVTESVAKNIAYEYPTVRTLYENYLACQGERQMSEMLVGIKKGTTVLGQTTHRQIGPAISEAVYKTFMSTDGEVFV